MYVLSTGLKNEGVMNSEGGEREDDMLSYKQ